jgi:hypothetical protein
MAELNTGNLVIVSGNMMFDRHKAASTVGLIRCATFVIVIVINIKDIQRNL